MDGSIGGALLEAAEDQTTPPSAPDPREEKAGRRAPADTHRGSGEEPHGPKMRGGWEPQGEGQAGSGWAAAGMA